MNHDYRSPDDGFATYAPLQLPAVVQNDAWLIDKLWLNEACGIIGGEPKTAKTFLALAMAVAVASGKPCLNRFATQKPAAVLLYSAEHCFRSLRQRIESTALRYNTRFDELNIHIIPATAEMRLDLEHRRLQLLKTVERITPALVILDPFSRIHQVNENLTHEVAPLLGFLRELQQRFKTAVAVVHHTRKSTAATRPGQSLRGTSDLHAWGDSNLYLAHHSDRRLNLHTEHRNASSDMKMQLVLQNYRSGTTLDIVATTAAKITNAPN